MTLLLSPPMNLLPFVCSAAFVCPFLAFAEVEYSTFNTPSQTFVTGVRSDSAETDSVVMTASITTGGVTHAGLYHGSLQAAISGPASAWKILTPEIAGQTVTSSTLYGPNTARYDSSLLPGEIVAVGSYKYTTGSSGPDADHGVIFRGTADGVGTWTQIDATPLVGGGESLLNTIAHSNMNGLVVGNYDTDLATGKAFLYNMNADTWIDFNPAGSASITAYGIWHHGGDSSLYTIAGGYSDLNSLGVDMGYLVTYDLESGEFSGFTSFNFKNQPIESVISHFDGITGVEGGFALTGDQVSAGLGETGFYAFVPYVDGEYGPAVWTEISYPGFATTSGNTIVENNVLGVYVDDGAVKSFVATVPEPGTAVLAIGGLLLLAPRRSRGSRMKD